VVSQVTDQEYQMPVKDFNELLYQKAVESAARRGIPRSMVPPISRYTISNYEKIIGAKRKSSESTTWARADAQGDIRNAVSFAVMNSLMVPLTEPDLIINSDATQYTVGGGAKRVQVIMISRDEAQEGPIKSKPQKSDGGLMAYFKKHYATVSAMGCSATPVFMATDDNMKVDDIDVYAVPGLGNGTDVGCEGLLVFLKTRVPTIPFYIWFIKEVLVPFVTDIRSAAGGCLDGKLAWFQLDGEAEQIAPYQLKEVQTLLKDNNIVVEKPPGGTTSWTQPLDRGNYFKASKTALKNIKDSDAARFKLGSGLLE
jgi:hypothetical protein